MLSALSPPISQNVNHKFRFYCEVQIDKIGSYFKYERNEKLEGKSIQNELEKGIFKIVLDSKKKSMPILVFEPHEH